MASHIRVVAWLHVVFGALGMLIALVALLLFGGVAGLIAVTDHSSDARAAAPILSIIGAIAFVVIAALSAPGLAAGIGLLRYRSWARIVAIIISALHLFSVPFGTALGVYSLWALLSAEGARLFD